MSNARVMAATIATAVLVGAGLGTAQAQPGPGGGRHHDPLLEGVTLTADQQSKIEALHKAAWATDKPLFDQVRTVSEQIDTALLSSGSVTEAQITPLLQQKETLMQQLDASRLSQQIATRNLLTSAQIAQAAQTHAQLAALRQQEDTIRSQSEGAGGDVPPGGP